MKLILIIFLDEQLLDIQRHELYDPSSPADSSNDSPSSASQSDSYDEESLDRLFIFPIKENKLIFNLTVKEGSNSVRGNLRRALLNLKLKDVPVKSSPNISIHVLRNLFDVEGTQLGWAHPVSRFTPNEPFALDSSSSIHWHKYDFTRLLDLTDNYDVFNTNRFLANSNPLLQVSLRSAKVLSAFITLEYENIEVGFTFELSFLSASPIHSAACFELQVSRGKRSVDCSASGNPKTCCREQFYVNFTTIGWHSWILQPPGYFANYCKGKCDVSHARYHHTTVLSKYTQLVSLCCSPREMSQISLIYMDEDKYVFQKNLPNMVVESCDCA